MRVGHQGAGKVSIADGDPDIVASPTTAWEAAGYAAVSAGSPEEGLEKVRAERSGREEKAAHREVFLRVVWCLCLEEERRATRRRGPHERGRCRSWLKSRRTKQRDAPSEMVGAEVRCEPGKDRRLHPRS